MKTDVMEIKALYELYKQHPVITTDSRDCPKGSIFLALKGESFNGNKFALQALEKGCAYAIVDEESEELRVKSEELAVVLHYNPIIKVADTLQTFKDLAREHRRRFDIPVVGITGTNGKTTTKELIAAVLGKKYNVMYTEGNFNNDVGVPKTLFRLNDSYDIAVVEMGASHPGDIKTLVETVEPTCGLITNVGRAHLQGFGSFEGVMKTKGELYDFLKKREERGERRETCIFLDADNEYLVKMAKERDMKNVITYGSNVGKVVSCDPFVNFEWYNDQSPVVVRTHLIGAYNISNILAAMTVGKYFDVPADKIREAIEEYTPSNNRSQLTITADNRLVVDAYNANPTSMAAAIENFKAIKSDKELKKMAIIGQMGELGDVAEEEHRKVLQQLIDANLDKIWLVGEGSWDIAAGRPGIKIFKDVEEVKTAIGNEKPCGYYILIKGSHSNRLDKIVELL